MKNLKQLLLIFLPIHVGSLMIPWLTDFSYTNLIYFLIGYVLISGLGNNVGLHRAFGHRSVELGPVSKRLVLFLSLMVGQGHPIWWAAVHRGQHHRYSDTDRDSHSPVAGRWHAFFGWILKHDPNKVVYRHATDLLRDPIMVQTSRYYEAIVIGTWVAVGLISVDLLLYMFLLPSLVALHLEGCVNLFCHSKVGYRNFETQDQSRNVPILGYLNWGNGWHNNHHYNSNAYDFGSGVSGRSREFDPCVVFKPLLKY